MASDPRFSEFLGVDLPPLEFIGPEAMPRPYRDLLVHRSDMTGKLESYYGQKIHLETLYARHGDDCLIRQVLLKIEDGRTVEFGAIRIHLDVFAGEARERVLGCRQPLGGILNEFAIPYRSRLSGFFQLKADDKVRRILDTNCAATLYGRQNRLTRDDDKPIAEVVEILPT